MISAVLDAVLATSGGLYVLLFVAYLVIDAYLVRNRMGIKDVPGPLLAQFSNLWKVAGAIRADMPWRNIAAHEKYGPLVRIGRNHVSASDPEAVKTIYNFTNIWRKSDFFGIGEGFYQGKKLATLFTTQSNEYHSHLKRGAAQAFSMTALTELEPYVNNCVSLLMQRLDEGSLQGNRAMDISPWMQYFAFDVLGEVNFGRQLGFLRTGSDVDRNIEGVDLVLKYVALVGQTPYLHNFLLGNPLIPKLFPDFEKQNKVLEFAVAMVTERQQNPIERHDILARLLETHNKDSSKLSIREIVAITTTNILAGSDTTAITLRAVLYFLCKHPRAIAALQAEIDAADAAGRLSRPARYAECAPLPYLSAVIHETTRVHPPIGFVLERLVPAGGVTLCGTFLPANTVVGASAWVVHRDRDVFGADADVWRPERWVEAAPDKVQEMHRHMMTFGAGPRACIGKHISLLEIWKVVTEMVRTFDFALADPKMEVQTAGTWFTKQGSIPMIFKRRSGINKVVA